MADILGIDFPELPRPVAPDLAPPRYMVRHKRRVDFYVNGAPVAALVASGVLACVTILPDGRHWYSYGGESAIGAPDARYMAICDLPGALSVARSYRRGEPLYAYK